MLCCCFSASSILLLLLLLPPLGQVSAAAQRAEAEAQKHLVVHAQVAAQAQELQQKAVHLQVGAAQAGGARGSHLVFVSVQ